MIDLDEFCKIVEEGLAGLPDDLLARHRAQMMEAIERSLTNKARAAVQRRTAPDLGLLSIRELRRRAKDASVYRYGSMDKAELVAALAKVGGAHPTGALAQAKDPI